MRCYKILTFDVLNNVQIRQTSVQLSIFIPNHNVRLTLDLGVSISNSGSIKPFPTMRSLRFNVSLSLLLINF
jgi:hypothetical protein